MSFKQGTEHYDLPQYAQDDTPSWVQDMTGAFEKIDTTMYQIADQSNTSSGAVENLQNSVANLTTTVTKNTQDIGNAQTDIANNYTELKNADTQLSNRIAANTANITAQTQQIAAINDQLADLQPEPIEELKNDVNALKTTVGNTNIASVGDGTLTGGLVSVDNAQGLETRVNPTDTSQPQWRVKGSEGEWENFNTGVVEVPIVVTTVATAPFTYTIPLTNNGKYLLGINNLRFNTASEQSDLSMVKNVLSWDKPLNNLSFIAVYGGGENIIE